MRYTKISSRKVRRQEINLFRKLSKLREIVAKVSQDIKSIKTLLFTFFVSLFTGVKKNAAWLILPYLFPSTFKKQHAGKRGVKASKIEVQEKFVVHFEVSKTVLHYILNSILVI